MKRLEKKGLGPPLQTQVTPEEALREAKDAHRRSLRVFVNGRRHPTMQDLKRAIRLADEIRLEKGPLNWIELSHDPHLTTS